MHAYRSKYICWDLVKTRVCTDLLGGNTDLAGFLVGLLQDEPDHLLHLLPDVGVVHLDLLAAN